MPERFELFVLSINRIYRAIQRIKSREMTELGLKGPHVMCLYQLRRHSEGLTAAELGALCLEDKAAVSRAVARLEELGLVRLQGGGQRRYRAKIRLTDAGAAAAETMAGLIERAVQLGGAGLTEDQRAAFYEALGTIAGNLERLCAEEDSL